MVINYARSWADWDKEANLKQRCWDCNCVERRVTQGPGWSRTARSVDWTRPKSNTQHWGVCFPCKRIILSSCWNRFRALNSVEDPALLFSYDLSIHRLQSVCAEGPEGLQNTGKWRESCSFTQSGNFSTSDSNLKGIFPFLSIRNGSNDMKVCYTSGPEPLPGQHSQSVSWKTSKREESVLKLKLCVPDMSAEQRQDWTDLSHVIRCLSKWVWL